MSGRENDADIGLLGSGGDRIARARTRDVLVRYRNLVRIALTAGACACDLAALVAAALVGAALRQGALETNTNWQQTLGVLVPTYGLAAIAFGAYRMRTLRSWSRSVVKALMALVLAASFGFCAAFALQVGARFSRLETAYTILIAGALLILVRLIGAVMLRRVFHAAVAPTVVVISDGNVAVRRAGAAPLQWVDVRAAGLTPSLTDPAFFDRIGVFVRDADRVVLSFDDPAERLQWAEAMRLSGLDAEIVADLGEVQPLALSHWQGQATLVISRGPLNLGERLLKRGFDVAVTLAVMPFVGPVIAVLALLVKYDTPGPAFFVQQRVGRNNRSYRCYKLRTMRTEAVDAGGTVSAARGDQRVTRLGKFLRRSSLDELPQLLNVLTGDMSLVGPRPHALGSRAEGALFWELVPDYWSRHAMKPGLTGLAQVRGLRGATHYRSDIERRVAADLEYINGWSLWLDIKILVRTVAVMIHRNAY